MKKFKMVFHVEMIVDAKDEEGAVDAMNERTPFFNDNRGWENDVEEGFLQITEVL